MHRQVTDRSTAHAREQFARSADPQRPERSAIRSGLRARTDAPGAANAGMSGRALCTAPGVVLAAIAVPLFTVAPSGRAGALGRTAPLALSSTAPAWTATDIDGSRSLDDINCPSRRLCVAVDSQGDALTMPDPAAGAVTWHRARIDRNALAGVTCASVRFCVAYDEEGGVGVSTHPLGGARAWRLTASGVPVIGDMA